MKVSIKGFEVEMSVGTKGVEFAVYDGSKYKGDLVVSRNGVTWCKLRTKNDEGIRVTWGDLIRMFEAMPKAPKVPPPPA